MFQLVPLPLLLILLAGIAYSVLHRKLTLDAALVGAVLALLIFAGAGYTGVTMMSIFFVSGTIATSVGKRNKQQAGLQEMDKGRRNVSQVLANAGVAALAGLLILLFPKIAAPLQVAMAASLAAACSDTLSSELGNVYGRSYVNILTFKPDRRGLDGVISWEGCLFGLAGSFLIAAVFGLGFGYHWAFWVVAVAGMAGNLLDSIFGASLQRKGYLTNDAVNFLNTLAAALLSYVFITLIGL
ncbi:DUF92 domain-containing protein [Pedobacter sp. SYSU D00535]|uniref:DUF92 domain-containing protein n=1 Tax=Pedobacter sp. SYSU D00535 TaxID=2810308 RepID=UPI001A9593E9|nr:DUF92 domain-containing protein [Pedobacter sp. SYSU D00535]